MFVLAEFVFSKSLLRTQLLVFESCLRRILTDSVPTAPSPLICIFVIMQSFISLPIGNYLIVSRNVASPTADYRDPSRGNHSNTDRHKNTVSPKRHCAADYVPRCGESTPRNVQTVLFNSHLSYLRAGLESA